MREADADRSETITFGELVSVMHKLKKDPNSAAATYVRKIHKAPAQVWVMADVVEAVLLLCLGLYVRWKGGALFWR